MEFRLLGPLEVVRDGRPLALGGAKQRAVLAVLLVHRNQVVPAERIIDAVWGESPPATAANALQGYVFQLRKILEPDHRRGAPYELLASDGTGYALRVTADQVDADRFAELVERGRALASRDPAAASALLADALALWRGPPLADLAYESFAQGEIARLEELRLAALEDRLDAELACGRHAGVVGELEALVPAHPLRERLRGLLMLALYRSGRQAEALDAYRATREALVDALGIEPGAELQALHGAILRQDAALAHGAEPDTAPPSRLPAPTTSLVGRERELRELRALLHAPQPRLITLTGPGGVGKTRLSLELARLVEREFPDGARFVAGAGLRDPQLVVAAVASAFDGEDLGRASGLILLDNVEQVLEAGPALAELLSTAAGLRVVATSREPFRLLAEREFPVPSLPPVDAAALFVERARAVDPAFVGDDRVAEVCRRLDGLPLAVELTAVLVRDLGFDQLYERLDARLRLLVEGPRDLPERHRSLRAALEWSYELLPEAEAVGFARLSVFAGGCTPDAAEVVCEASKDVLAALARKSLLRREDGRYRFLETVREFAAEQLEHAGPEPWAATHADWCLALAEEAVPALSGEEQAAWLDRLEREHDNFRAAFDWSEEAGRHDLQLRLAVALRQFWYVRAHYSEGRSRLEAALAHADDGDSRLRAKALQGASTMARMLGDRGEESRLAAEALDLCRAIGDREGLAFLLRDTANSAANAGEHERARALFEESAALFRELDLGGPLGGVLSSLGDLSLREGEWATATELCTESLALQRAGGAVHGAAISLLNLSLASHAAGRLEEARRLAKESIETSRELGDLENVASALAAVAASLTAKGDAIAAAQMLGKAADIRTTIGAALDDLERSLYDRSVAEFERRLGQRRFTSAYAEGAAMPLEDVVERALSLD